MSKHARSFRSGALGSTETGEPLAMSSDPRVQIPLAVSMTILWE
jgi:hypothetical protein